MPLNRIIGHETGGEEEYEFSTGATSVGSSFALTGNYGARAISVGTKAYNRIEYSGGGRPTISLRIKLITVDTGDVLIVKGFAYVDGTNDLGVPLYITSGRYLKGNSSTGTTQLNLNTIYRVALVFKSDTQYDVYLDGSIELTNEAVTSETGLSFSQIPLGILSEPSDEFELYWDDVVTEMDTSSDPGDIRVLAARPVGEGSHQDTGTGSAWQDSDNTPAVFSEIDNDPPNTTDYNWCEADGSTYDYSVELDNCGSGNLADIGGSDTIEAVHFMWYYATDGGGVGDYASLIQDQDSDTIDWTIDDPKDPTWLSSYEADCPSDGDPWTQDNFADVEMGMSCKDANKDMWFYEAYAMVAYKVVPIEAWVSKIIMI